MKTLVALAALLLAAAPLQAAPLKTKAEAARICATLGTSYQDTQQCMEEQYYLPLEKLQQSRAAEQARWDAIPVGAPSGASVNGVEISKCSHGGLCLGQMVEAMRRGY